MAFGGIGLLLMILFWVLVIAGGVWLVKAIFPSLPRTHTGKTNSSQASPRKILNQRYARGEISREEYERIKSDLV